MNKYYGSAFAVLISFIFLLSILLFLSSCGSNNPLSAKSPNSVTVPSGLVVTPNTPPTLDPASKSPLPPWFPTDPASMSCVLSEPHANINASGPSKPFDQICGLYDQTISYQWVLLNWGPVWAGASWIPVDMDLYKIVVTHYYPHGGVMQQTIDKTKIGTYNTGKPLPTVPPPKTASYSVDCNDPCFKGMNLPDDFFHGDGFPDGCYVAGGNLYEKGTDAAGKPTVKNWGPSNYPDGVYPKPSAPPPPVAPTLMSLVIEPMDVSVGVGKVVQFNIKGLMSDGSTDPSVNNGNVTWSSSDTTVAVIYNGATDGGKVWAKAKGNADITASYTSPDGTIVPSNVAVVHVGNQLKSISISPVSATIYIYPTKGIKQYTASGNYTDGSTQSPITVDWKLSDTSIATIDNTGLAMAGSKPGITYISASSQADGSMAFSDLPNKELRVECRNYTYYSQRDLAWANILYAYHKPPWNESPITNTIGKVGCAMTATSMILDTVTSSFDVPYMYYPLNPGNLDSLLVALELYTHFDNFIYPYQVLPMLAPNQIVSATSCNYASSWSSELDTCAVIIAHIYAGTDNGHYVLVIGHDYTGRFISYDPYNTDLQGRIRYITSNDIVPDWGSTLVKFK